MLKKLLTLTICLLFLSTIANAWLDGYGYRKIITIQGANLDSNVTHFPLLIYIVDADIDDHCDDDGDRSFDILFTQSDDSVLDVNWEDYSEAGGNATITAWVSDAGWTIESDGSTEIYLYYGNAAAGDPGTDEGVWDGNYLGVWHLNEASNPYLDSTSNDNDSVAGTYPTQTTGKIFKGQDFDTTNDYIDFGDLASFEGLGSMTVTAWAYSEETAADHAAIVDKAYDATGISSWALLQRFNVARFSVYTGSAVHATGVVAINGSWHYLAGIYDGSDVYLYVDGEPDGSNSQTGNTGTNAFTVKIGKWDQNESGDFDQSFNGLIDEVRFSDTNRNADWIKFEHANMNEGDNELSWAGEEEAPSDGFIPRVIIIR